jgi:hypothetical protein
LMFRATRLALLWLVGDRRGNNIRSRAGPHPKYLTPNALARINTLFLISLSGNSCGLAASAIYLEQSNIGSLRAMPPTVTAKKNKSPFPSRFKTSKSTYRWILLKALPKSVLICLSQPPKTKSSTGYAPNQTSATHLTQTTDPISPVPASASRNYARA